MSYVTGSEPHFERGYERGRQAALREVRDALKGMDAYDLVYDYTGATMEKCVPATELDGGDWIHRGDVLLLFGKGGRFEIEEDE